MSRRKDPICTSRDCPYVGRVSWPEPYQPGQTHASTYVCADEGHQADASAWVESVTGHAGVFVPFARQVAPALAVQEATSDDH